MAPSQHVVLSSFPVDARLHNKVTHARELIARDLARAKKVRSGMQPHGPLALQEAAAKRRHHQTKPPASKPSSEPSGGVDSIDVTDAGVTYTMGVAVGGANFTLLIDTGSSNTWVGADKKYSPSSSAQDTRNTFTVGYGSGKVSGTEYIDTCQLGPDLIIQEQSVGVARTATGFNGVDGILGIGPVDLTEGTVGNTGTVPTVTDNLLKQGTISVESIGCFYAPTKDDTMGKGELTFGGSDSSKFTGDMTYVPITKTSPASKYWGCDQTLTYGSTQIMSTSAGIVDTGTTLILLASDAFTAYQKATGATMDSTTGLLKLTQAQFDAMSSLNFQIGDMTCELIPNAQIWPRSMNSMLGGDKDGIYCVVADIGEIGGQGLDFIDGFAFLQRFYTEYDTTNARIGFAQTAHTMDQSN